MNLQYLAFVFLLEKKKRSMFAGLYVACGCAGELAASLLECLSAHVY